MPLSGTIVQFIMAPQIVDAPPTTIDLETGHESENKKNTGPDEISAIDEKKDDQIPAYQQDAFGNEEFAEVKYKVLKWWYVLGFIILLSNGH